MNEHERYVINSCGMKEEPLNLYVSVQFIDFHDAMLAKEINNLFNFGLPGSQWKTKQPEHVQWKDNPLQARIVVFSEHENAYTIKKALGHLLGERVSHASKRIPPADITIVIFPKEQ